MAGVGPPCWADGPTAAALYGIRGYARRPPFHLLILRDRFIHRVGHYLHQSIDLPPIDRESVRGLAAVSPTRALINLARYESADRLGRAVASAMELGLTSEELLHRRLVALRASGRHGLPKLLAVIEGYELAAGPQSWLEREFLRLVADAGLPDPLTQQVLGRRGDRLIRVDFRWPGTPVVVEALGYRWHRTTAQMAVDSERMNQLVLTGLTCLQFTYGHITADLTMSSAWSARLWGPARHCLCQHINRLSVYVLAQTHSGVDDRTVGSVSRTSRRGTARSWWRRGTCRRGPR